MHFATSSLRRSFPAPAAFAGLIMVQAFHRLNPFVNSSVTAVVEVFRKTAASFSHNASFP
jgi:hypothetical protein